MKSWPPTEKSSEFSLHQLFKEWWEEGKRPLLYPNFPLNLDNHISEKESPHQFQKKKRTEKKTSSTDFRVLCTNILSPCQTSNSENDAAILWEKKRGEPATKKSIFLILFPAEGSSSSSTSLFPTDILFQQSAGADGLYQRCRWRTPQIVSCL